MSHMEAEVVEDLINDLKNHFGELVMTRGKKHTFWGMNINITEEKKVEIEMKKQLLESIEAFVEDPDEKLTTPAYSHLFIFNKQKKQLDEEKRKIFHLVVVKILYIMKRARPDSETAILCLCRRVSKIDVDEWEKINRLMLWVEETIDDKIIIGSNILTNVYTWVGADYVIDSNMRSHTGGGISMGLQS